MVFLAPAKCVPVEKMRSTMRLPSSGSPNHAREKYFAAELASYLRPAMSDFAGAKHSEIFHWSSSREPPA